MLAGEGEKKKKNLLLSLKVVFWFVPSLSGITVFPLFHLQSNLHTKTMYFYMIQKLERSRDIIGIDFNNMKPVGCFLFILAR